MHIVKLPGTSVGATVTDVDLSDLRDDEWESIEAAFLEHGMLVFPAQHLSADDQSAFGARFGDFEFGQGGYNATYFEKAATVPTSTTAPTKAGALTGALNTAGTSPPAQAKGPGGTVRMGNEDARDGSLLEEDSQRMQINLGNEDWHTDSSYMPLASKVAMLAADKVPEIGGETGFADMRAAFDSLDAETQAELEQLSAYHSLHFSQAVTTLRLGLDTQWTQEVNSAFYGYHGEAYLRPLVKTHPETGRKNLFIGRHAYGVTGPNGPLGLLVSRSAARALCSFSR